MSLNEEWMIHPGRSQFSCYPRGLLWFYEGTWLHESWWRRRWNSGYPVSKLSTHTYIMCANKHTHEKGQIPSGRSKDSLNTGHSCLSVFPFLAVNLERETEPPEDLCCFPKMTDEGISSWSQHERRETQPLEGKGRQLTQSYLLSVYFHSFLFEASKTDPFPENDQQEKSEFPLQNSFPFSSEQIRSLSRNSRRCPSSAGGILQPSFHVYFSKGRTVFSYSKSVSWQHFHSHSLLWYQSVFVSSAPTSWWLSWSLSFEWRNLWEEYCSKGKSGSIEGTRRTTEGSHTHTFNPWNSRSFFPFLFLSWNDFQSHKHIRTIPSHALDSFPST